MYIQRKDLDMYLHTRKVSEYDQEMPQSHTCTVDQPPHHQGEIQIIYRIFSRVTPRRHRGSYMSAHVLLNLLNEFGKSDARLAEH